MRAMARKCTKCDETDPKQFSKCGGNAADGLRSQCKRCINAQHLAAKAKRMTDPNYAAKRHAQLERARTVHHYKRYYGMTLEKYNSMLAQQGGLCANPACRKPETVSLRGREPRLSVDHSHTTNQVRGLLCRACNIICGVAKDRPELLLGAAEYLGRYIPVQSSEIGIDGPNITAPVSDK